MTSRGRGASKEGAPIVDRQWIRMTVIKYLRATPIGQWVCVWPPSSSELGLRQWPQPYSIHRGWNVETERRRLHCRRCSSVGEHSTSAKYRNWPHRSLAARGLCPACGQRTQDSAPQCARVCRSTHGPHTYCSVNNAADTDWQNFRHNWPKTVRRSRPYIPLSVFPVRFLPVSSYSVVLYTVYTCFGSCVKVKVKVNVDLYSALSWTHLLGYGTRSQGVSQFCLHTPRSSANRMNHTCLCLPSRSWYSFTDPGGMEGWVGLGYIRRLYIHLI